MEPNPPLALWFPGQDKKFTRNTMGQPHDPASLMRQIDENLRRVYRDEPVEEVPDKFAKLLEKLKEQDTKNGK